MSEQSRVFIDCREHPSESNCSLRIAGTADEVLETARQHVITLRGELKAE